MDSLKTLQEIATLLNDAIAEHQQNHLQPALDKYLEILTSSPKHPDALHLAGLIYYQSGQNSLAIEYIEKAISISPNQASYYSNLGLTYAAENNFDKAIENYKKAIRITPNYPEARYNLGNAYRAIGKINSAIKNYKKTIQIKPDYAQAYNSLGLVLQKKGKIIEAQIEFKKALSFDSSDYSIYNNLGVIAADLDNPKEAISNFEKAISLIENNHKTLSTSSIPEKKHIDIYHNIGLAYINIGNFKKAINYIDQALQIDKSDTKIRFSKSIAYLGDGNFPFGWKEYVFRPKKEGITGKYLDILEGLKEWDLNKSPSNTPLVILPEQGIGDEIMFASIIPDLIKNKEREITLACDNRLISIFERSFKNITVTTLDNLNTTPEMQKIHLGSLPQYFRNSESDFKPPQPYISPNNKTAQYFHDKYSDIEGLRIGIAWKSGNPDQGEKRSLSLNRWKDILSIPGCSFFNLQYGNVQQEIDEFTSKTGIEIINDNEVDQLKSIEDFIAQISTLDLIITIDNSTAHIAGALGIPTWVLLQYNCDWRWMRDRSDSIWYKSLKLYRQKEIGDWNNVLEKISADLLNYHNKAKHSVLAEKPRIEHIMKKATSLQLNKQYDEAIKYYNVILESEPTNSDVLYFCSMANFELGRYKEAETLIMRAIAYDDLNAQLYNDLAIIYNKQKKWNKAETALKKAIKIAPDMESSYINLGNIYKDTNKFDTAQDAYEKALSINNKNYMTYNNIAMMQRKLSHPEAAINNFKKSIQINTTSDITNRVNAYTNLGMAYLDLSDFDNAHKSFDKAIEIDDSNIDAKFSKALTYLSQGEFKKGWKLHETRLQGPDYHEGNLDAINFWDNTSEQKKSPLIVIPEQGVGDIIMYARTLPDLIKDHEGKIILTCDERLIDIFKRSFNDISVTKLKGAQITSNHKKIFIGSLPKYYKNSESSFNQKSAYIFPQEDRKKYFQEKYSTFKGLKVGFTWKSGNLDEGTKRTIPLSKLNHILSTPNCTFFNLQYGDVQQEIDEFTSQTGIEIINDTEVDQLKSIEDFIAQISVLDLIITIDNSTAHMTGALGIPTWVMLPYNCDWRWMRDRNDSLWYKSLRLYRQKVIGDWSNVTKEVMNDLTDRNIQPKADSQPPVAVKPTQNQSPKKKVQTSAASQNQKRIKTDRKIAFLNDTTAWYHWGCTATSEAIRKRIIQNGYKSLNVPINFSYNFKCIPQTSEDFDNPEFFNNASKTHNDLFQAINSCDQVVINGEGSIHHLSKVSLSLLYMAYACKKFLNKPVHIINHSPYPENVREPQDNFAFQLYKAVYNQLNYIAIREHISHKLMTSYGIDASLSFDCLPITVTEDYKPEKLDAEKNIVVSGSVSFSKDRITDLGKLMQHFHQQGYKIKVLHGAKAFPAQDDLIFIQELQTIDFKSYEVIDAKSLTEWLDCINSAAVFISGRFHHSLAAIYLETPCVMMESNTLKNVALAESFNLPEPIKFDSEDFFEELLERTEKALTSEPVDIALRTSLLQRSEVNFEKIKDFG